MVRRVLVNAGLILVALATVGRCAELMIKTDSAVDADGLPLVGAMVLVDPSAAAVVHEAGNLLINDLTAVTGKASTTQPSDGHSAILVGTIGDGGLVDALVQAGKVDATGVRDQWESFAWQIVNQPTPSIPRALVIVGSDRRGTAYGCTELSRAIGVSPWTWWSDVPITRHEQVSVTAGRKRSGPPGVKYRGIFINDEDFGLRQWASKSFDPPHTEIGPKTYNKIFELMLRLRLNYLWPAMHPGSGEFGSIPGNVEMADHWAIVMGASHCEPMLRNNVYWPHELGPWRYDTNRDNILKYWTESAEQRGNYEAVWTMGIRGIHDTSMQGPPAIADRVKMVEGIFADQEKLIADKVSKQFGEPAKCFVPYKEVLPLYDAGMKVPDEATLVWPDDNFGYIRHLPTAEERKRAGGNGVYYHISYWGGPHSYLWVESTPLVLMWEELHKAWENDAGRLWVLNVGDTKPGEVAIDFYSKLAWNPDAWGPNAQEAFLKSFLTETFGASAVEPLLKLESRYFEIASRRKPEFFMWPGRNVTRVEWLDSLSQSTFDEVVAGYDELASLEQHAAAAVPADRADSYYEMIGYAARALSQSGKLYVALSRANRDPSSSIENLDKARAAMQQIETDTDRFNNGIAGSKWRGWISLIQTDLEWPTVVGGTRQPTTVPTSFPDDTPKAVIDAANYTKSEDQAARWLPVCGLGRSGRAITVLPSKAFGTAAPAIKYDFNLPTTQDDARVRLDVLPTMRLDRSGHLRLSIAIDDALAKTYDVPGGESSDENSGPRRDAVLSNQVTIDLPRQRMTAGWHELVVTAVDPGVVIDQIELPAGAVLK